MDVLIDAMLITLLAAAFASFRWLKLSDLTGGDSARWLLEAHRAASGEQPYRDFSIFYPPVAIWTLGSAMRVFGSSFVVAQVVLDLLSTVLCLLVWMIARALVRRGPALALAAMFAAAGASNTGNFALFSLDLYAPGVLTGAIGFLVFLLPLVRRLAEPSSHEAARLDVRLALTLSGGATVACLSKLEFACGVVGGCVLYPLLVAAKERRWSWSLVFKRSAVLAAVSSAPSLVVLAALAMRVGPRTLVEALGCYGCASRSCPWWPTGLGLLSIVSAWARVLVVVASVSLVRFQALWAQYGRRYVAFLVVGAIALVIAWRLLPYAVADFVQSQPKGISQAALFARYFLSLTSLLHPVMWASTALALGAVIRLMMGQPLSPSVLPWLLLVGAGAILSARTLFGDLFSRVGVVFPTSYPIWFLLVAGLTLLLFDKLGGAFSRRQDVLASGILVLYACVRVAGMIQGAGGGLYRRLETEAGPVRLRAHGAGTALYRAVIQMTTPTSRVLEIPYGGGLVFASHRKASLYLTQFVELMPSASVEKIDNDKLVAAPPDLVVAEAAPHFSIGKGLFLGCSLPRFTFEPPAHDPANEPEQPSIAWIEAHYRVVSKIANKLILVPERGTPATQ